MQDEVLDTLGPLAAAIDSLGDAMREVYQTSKTLPDLQVALEKRMIAGECEDADLSVFIQWEDVLGQALNAARISQEHITTVCSQVWNLRHREA